VPTKSGPSPRYMKAVNSKVSVSSYAPCQAIQTINSAMHFHATAAELTRVSWLLFWTRHLYQTYVLEIKIKWTLAYFMPSRRFNILTMSYFVSKRNMFNVVCNLTTLAIMSYCINFLLHQIIENAGELKLSGESLLGLYWLECVTRWGLRASQGPLWRTRLDKVHARTLSPFLPAGTAWMSLYNNNTT